MWLSVRMSLSQQLLLGTDWKQWQSDSFAMAGYIFTTAICYTDNIVNFTFFLSNYSPGPGSADFILDPLKDKNLKSKTIRRRATTILDFGSYSIVLEWNFVSKFLIYWI